jgi:aspartyl/asparaginyl-tRNA synthetase
MARQITQVNKRCKANLSWQAYLITISLLALTILSSFPTLSLASPARKVTFSELIEKATLIDGSKIEIRGEVVGDIMKRPNGVWINVHDGTAALGIWLTPKQGNLVKQGGDYNWQGDRIDVVGSFNKSCPQHGGDMDIHAQQIEVIEEAKPIKHPLQVSKLIWLFALFFIALASKLALNWQQANRREV